MHWKDVLPAVAILGPIIAAIITLLVTRRWQRSKQVTFWVASSEDLTLPLKRSEHFVVVEIGAYRGLDFNRGVVTAKNTGHAMISGVVFDVSIPGEHQLALAEVRSDDRNLSASAKIERRDDQSPTYNPTFKITIPFLNPKDAFEVVVFFDKEPVNCNISCRMEDVVVRIRRGQHEGPWSRAISASTASLIASGVTVALIASAAASAVLSEWLKHFFRGP